MNDADLIHMIWMFGIFNNGRLFHKDLLVDVPFTNALLTSI
jgi:hypothetical protein